MKYSEELIERIRLEMSALMCTKCLDCLYDNDIESIIDIVKEGLE